MPEIRLDTFTRSNIDEWVDQFCDAIRYAADKRAESALNWQQYPRDARADAVPGDAAADCGCNPRTDHLCREHTYPSPDAGRPLGHADADDGWTSTVHECEGYDDVYECLVRDGYHAHNRKRDGVEQYQVVARCTDDRYCLVTGHDHARADGGE